MAELVDTSRHLLAADDGDQAAALFLASAASVEPPDGPAHPGGGGFDLGPGGSYSPTVTVT